MGCLTQGSPVLRQFTAAAACFCNSFLHMKAWLASEELRYPYKISLHMIAMLLAFGELGCF